MELFNFDPETGIFTNKMTGRGRRPQGRESGCVCGQYKSIAVDGERRNAHLWVWLWMTGVYPEHQIDHINGDKHDNRWCNLRACNQSQNLANRRRFSYGGLAKGVRKLKGVTFQARICVNHHETYLGTFATEEEAHACWWGAARVAFGEFARRN